jgi:hypothetical protein
METSAREQLLVLVVTSYIYHSLMHYWALQLQRVMQDYTLLIVILDALILQGLVISYTSIDSSIGLAYV